MNRAYYAIFNITRAYLLHVGQPIDGRHGSILQAFGLHLVKTGLIDRDFGRLFHRAAEVRSEADYGEGSVPFADAENLVAGAEVICQRIATLLTQTTAQIDPQPDGT